MSKSRINIRARLGVVITVVAVGVLSIVGVVVVVVVLAVVAVVIAVPPAVLTEVGSLTTTIFVPSFLCFFFFFPFLSHQKQELQHAFYDLFQCTILLKLTVPLEQY